MDSFLPALSLLILLLPYGTLFYKKVNIRIRLLFATLFEIGLFYGLLMIAMTAGKDMLGYIHGFIFIGIVIVNLFFILVTWIGKSLK